VKTLKIDKVKSFKEIELSLPSSKSLTQRALVCASLADGESFIKNPLVSEDTQLLKQALEATGVKIEEKPEGWKIKGTKSPTLPQAKVYLGNNGTGSRFFLAYASLGKGDWIEIYGKPRLHERPVAPLVKALRTLGAKIECLEKEGFFPVLVRQGEISGGELSIPGNISSQFISALLLIGARLSQGLSLKIEGEMISGSYIEMTIQVMKEFGIKVEKDEAKKEFKVLPGDYTSRVYEVEADASSASYFLAIPLILGGGKVVIKNYSVNSAQGDVKFLDYIKAMGAEVKPLSPIGVEVSFQGRPKAVEVDLSDTPDLFPTMCVLCAVAEGKSILKGAPHLRYKETDRISAMVTELKKLGVNAEELPDGAIIEGTNSFKPALINTYDDHRIAMSFAILGLKTGEIEIENPDCVKKSFPNFWDYLKSIF